MSEGYIDYAQKCDVIFGAQRDIALQIPDVTDRDIQDIKYTGSGATMQAVSRAKDKIKRFRRRNSSMTPVVSGGGGGGGCHVVDDLPPPYSENPPVNPFYNPHPENGPPPGGACDDGHHNSFGADHPARRGDSPGDMRPLVVSPVMPPNPYHYSPLGHPPLYPVTPGSRSPTYQVLILL